MPRPEVSESTLDYWLALGFHAEDDEAGGDYGLLNFVAVLNAPREPILEIVSEGEDGSPPWSVLFDVDEAPAWALPHLSMYPGVVLTPEMDEAQQRAEIKAPTGWKRGQTASITLIAQRELTGTKWVRIRPRTPGPGQIYIRTLLAETPDPARVEAELRAGIPAWDVLDYEALEGVTVADVAAGWETVEEVAKAFPTVEALAHILPDELP